MGFKNKLFSFIYIAACILAIIISVTFFYISTLSYPVIKTYLDSLTADGNVDTYTEALHNSIIIKYRVLSIVLLAISILLFYFREKIKQFISDYLNDVRSYTVGKIKSAFSILKTETTFNKTILSFIFMAGILLRWRKLFSPIDYDEAFTYINYVTKPLFISLSDYSYPNNHLFHTLFAHISCAIFGNNIAALRLPSFIAGIIIIPATWLFTKKISNSHAPILATSIISFHPTIIHFSTIARGYSIITLLFLISIALITCHNALEKKGTWFWLLLFSVAGFYTIPVYIYPYLAITVLLLITITHYPQRKKLLRQLIIFNLILFASVIIVYLPAIIVSSIKSIIANEYIERLATDKLFEGIIKSIRFTYIEWTEKTSIITIIILATGFIFSLRKKKHFFPFLLSCFVVLSFIFIGKVVPPSRAIFFVFPLFIILSSIGIIDIINFILNPDIKKKHINAIVILIISALFIPPSIKKTVNMETDDNEVIALFLKTELKDGEKFMADLPFDYPIEFYMRKHSVPVDYLRKKNTNKTRIVFMINDGYRQTTNEIIEKLKIDTTLYRNSKLLKKFEYSSLYEMKKL